jgi:hypothetical protein
VGEGVYDLGNGEHEHEVEEELECDSGLVFAQVIGIG